jgi:restriction system protein
VLTQPVFVPPPRPAPRTPEQPPQLFMFLPPLLKGASVLVPGAKKKYERQVLEARAALQVALQEYERREAQYKQHESQYQAAFNAAKADFDRKVADFENLIAEQGSAVDELERRFMEHDPDAVIEYFTAALHAMWLPYETLTDPRVTFSHQSLQLVIELELPGLDVVPEAREFRYVKARDEIATSAMPTTDRRSLYTSLIAQTALRTIHAAFEADSHGVVETVVLNGHVRTVDRSTGQDIHPCLVTVRTTRDQFGTLNLTQVDAAQCLKGLNASLSKNPAELVPVRPVVDFDMADPRFVTEAQVLATLDTRPNLMDLSPQEFESLITNLFEKMGLETRLTQASRDGGVDCVAYDLRPIFGGKVVIQAKRYKNTVGVSAVRDLFGTMQNEGATKGILVTTSGYGKASHEFANGKPLELLDGANLLYLLNEHSGIEAKIEVPEDWVDPDPSM